VAKKTFSNPRDVEEILRRVRTLRPDNPRRWGRMSAHQMVCHLNDAFRMAVGERPTAGAPNVLQRTLIKWVALHLPLRWRPGIVTVPEIDQEIGGTRPADFAADLSELELRINTIAGRRRATWASHPIFGPLSEAQWLRWSYLHVDHHLRQFGH
jgi:hypothetical protein